MTTNNVTQLVAEVWYTPATQISETQLVAEVWYLPSPQLSETQLVAEVWYAGVPPFEEVSTFLAEVWTTPIIATEQVTSFLAEVWGYSASKLDVTAFFSEVWYTRPAALNITSFFAELWGNFFDPANNKVRLTTFFAEVWTGYITPPAPAPLPTPRTLYLRKQTASGDCQFGHSGADFYSPQVEAVRQRVLTRLLLMQYEWFLDLTDGTPYSTEILGVRTKPTYDTAIKSRIMGTQYVKDLLSYTSTLSNRDLSISATIDTEFGPTDVVTALNVYQVQSPVDSSLSQEASGLPLPPMGRMPLPVPSTLSGRYVRKQTDEGDCQFGHSAGDFWNFQVEAVRQTILTRLLLLQGEWFLNTLEGTPYATQILGVRTKPTYDIAIRQRILGTRYVNSITAYSSKLVNRALGVAATVDTTFGPVEVTTSLNIVGIE